MTTVSAEFLDKQDYLGEPANILLTFNKIISMRTTDLALNDTLGETRFGDRALSSYRQRWLSACVMGLCALLASCDNPNKKIGVKVSGYNHMPADSWAIMGFRVFGGSGPNLNPETGGGAFSCCAEIPARWHPGLKAKVEWYYAGNQEGPEPPPPQEVTVDVPDYGNKPGTVWVHFYADHKVRVVVGSYGIQHTLHKLSEKDKLPWLTQKHLIEP